MSGPAGTQPQNENDKNQPDRTKDKYGSNQEEELGLNHTGVQVQGGYAAARTLRIPDNFLPSSTKSQLAA
jgi:hypothetical protein